MHSGVKRNNEGKGAATLEWVGVTDIEVKQTGREGSWHTVDIQTSFYLIFVILDSEVADVSHTQTNREFFPSKLPSRLWPRQEGLRQSYSQPKRRRRH